MSFNYAPDPSVILGNPTNITLLTQRDVALDVPINFVTSPSVSVTAACFGHNTYEAEATSRCISNLLAVGFRRLYLDLYWDQRQLYWSLCPAELPLPAAGAQPSSSTTQSGTSTQLPGTVLSERGGQPSTLQPPREIRSATAGDALTELFPRQQLDPSTIGTHTTAAAGTNGAQLQPSPVHNVGQPAGTPSFEAGLQLYNIDPYACNTYANISTFLSVLNNYLDTTDTTTQASFKEIIFDLHVASAERSPKLPATAPPSSRLPNANNSIGGLAAASIPSYIYSPQTLVEQRANLNSSWSAAPTQDSPDSAYFTNITIPEQVSISPDGWPSEGFVEFFKTSRLLLGYGSVDPQLAGYDAYSDEQYVFPPGFLADKRAPTFSSNGSILSGCIYESGSTALSAVNSSWALASLTPSIVSSSFISTPMGSAPNVISTAAYSLANCGISPHLNTSLSNTTADVDPLPYLNFSLSIVWSWAPGQPLNDSAASSHDIPGMNDDNYSDGMDFRCAYLNTSDPSTPTGSWAVTFCQNRFSGACRSTTDPYAWTLSSQRGIYSQVADNCPSNSAFAVPRTPLENRYLIDAARLHFASIRNSEDDDDHSSDNLVWINFNSLDTENCWVSGANSTCPYTPTAGQNIGQVVVPTVAAFAIIVLAVLTILAKCGSNRRKSRKRRRVKGGWEYEGVPS